MIATVTAGGGASRASVLFTMTKVNGSTTIKTVAADASGVATWSTKLSPKDPSGTCTVKARASYNGLTGDDDARAEPPHIDGNGIHEASGGG